MSHETAERIQSKFGISRFLILKIPDSESWDSFESRDWSQQLHVYMRKLKMQNRDLTGDLRSLEASCRMQAWRLRADPKLVAPSPLTPWTPTPTCSPSQPQPPKELPHNTGYHVQKWSKNRACPMSSQVCFL